TPRTISTTGCGSLPTIMACTVTSTAATATAAAAVPVVTHSAPPARWKPAGRMLQPHGASASRTTASTCTATAATPRGQHAHRARGHPGGIARDARAPRQRVTHGDGDQRQVRHGATAACRPGGGERGGDEDQVDDRVHQLGGKGAGALGVAGEGRAKESGP